MKISLIKKLTLAGCFLGAMNSQAGVVIIDGFGTGPLNVADSQLRSTDVDREDWNARTTTAWSLSAGTLSVTPVNNTGYDPNTQGPVATIRDVPAAAFGEQINLKFDYDAGGGTLYFHLRGAVDYGSLNWNLNLSSGFGHMYDDDFGVGTERTRYDLTDGETLNTGATFGESRGFRDHTLSLTGSGSYNVSFFLQDDVVQDIRDYDFIALGFAHDGAGTAPVSISNLTLTAQAAPEPSSLALVLIGASLINLNRKRKLSRR